MKVKFVPQNIEVEIKPGQSVMHLAEDNGIYVKSVCRGVPSCAECRVRIVEGQGNALNPTRDELNLIGSGWFLDQRRLSCQLQCIGDVTVDMSEQIAKSQGLVLGQKKRKALQNDRVEDEVVIRDPSASRSGGEATDSDANEDEESARGPARQPNDRGSDRSRGLRPRSDRPSGPRTNSQQASPQQANSQPRSANSPDRGPRDQRSGPKSPGEAGGTSRPEGGRPEGGRRRRRGGQGRGGGPQGGGPQGGGAGPNT